ncbi:DUF4222 domain-containing protein [Escherichia coli]|nr:DUF4222 domain-containing protein [Escherichia coli]
MRQVNRWFKDHYGVPVRVIRWDPYFKSSYDNVDYSQIPAGFRG